MKSIRLNNYLSVRDALSNNSVTVENEFRRSRLIFGKTMLDSDNKDFFTQKKRILKIFNRSGLDDMQRNVITPVVETAGAGLLESDLPISISEFILQIPLRVICILLGISEDRYKDVYLALRPVIRCLDDPTENLAAAIDAREAVQRIIDSISPNLAQAKLVPTMVAANNEFEYRSYVF